jgi:DedD protein
MDQGLKERLIGAAVLVALGVWLIPWVLDGPEEQSISSASSLQLPVPEEPLPIRSQTLRLGEPEVSAPAVIEEAAVAARAAAEEPASPVAAAEPEPVAVERPVPVVVPPRPAAAAAPAASRPVPAPAVATGDWLVQLGSFGEEGNARRLAERVGTYGYKPDVSNYRASGRTMYRVRVGPLKSRGEAEAAASALTAHGFVAQVVTAE